MPSKFFNYIKFIPKLNLLDQQTQGRSSRASILYTRMQSLSGRRLSTMVLKVKSSVKCTSLREWRVPPGNNPFCRIELRLRSLVPCNKWLLGNSAELKGGCVATVAFECPDSNLIKMEATSTASTESAWASLDSVAVKSAGEKYVSTDGVVPGAKLSTSIRPICTLSLLELQIAWASGNKNSIAECRLLFLTRFLSTRLRVLGPWLLICLNLTCVPR